MKFLGGLIFAVYSVALVHLSNTVESRTLPNSSGSEKFLPSSQLYPAIGSAASSSDYPSFPLYHVYYPWDVISTSSDTNGQEINEKTKRALRGLASMGEHMARLRRGAMRVSDGMARLRRSGMFIGEDMARLRRSGMFMGEDMARL
jgi:hypothetical protein